jgi:uncharacterized OsmC-like protein
MNVFALFTTSPYTFLELGSTLQGNVIENEYGATGVVKLRDGLVQVDNMETYGAGNPSGDSTVHIRPSEAFLATVGGNLVGHGVRIAKDNHEAAEYRITGQVEGYDFDTGDLAFYKVNLKRESIATWDASELPLE